MLNSVRELFAPENGIHKKLPDDVEEQVLKHVGGSPEGLGIEGLSRRIGGRISRRSLQRVLAELVKAGRLNLEKRGRLSHYLLPAKAEEVTGVAADRVPPEDLDDFVRMAVKELEGMHESNFARFRLRPS